MLLVYRRAVEIRPSKVMSNAFRAAFHRLDQRARPLPVGSRLVTTRYRTLRAAASLGKWPRALTARRNLAFRLSIALVEQTILRISVSKSLLQNDPRRGGRFGVPVLSRDGWLESMVCGGRGRWSGGGRYPVDLHEVECCCCEVEFAGCGAHPASGEAVDDLL